MKHKKMAVKPLTPKEIIKSAFPYCNYDGRNYLTELLEDKYFTESEATLVLKRIQEDYESSDKEQLSSWDLDDIVEEYVKQVYMDDSIASCCGVSDPGMSEIKNTCAKSTYELAIALSRGFTDNFAAAVFTDNNLKSKYHKFLSELTTRIDLGVNPNSKKNIYMWVVTHKDCKNYLKNY